MEVLCYTVFDNMTFTRCQTGGFLFMGFIICFVISIIIVNILKKVIMAITGASALYISLKWLLGAYFFVAALIYYCVQAIF